MCGIAGFTSFYQNFSDKEELLSDMENALIHRGPDEGGRYTEGGIALLHRRLAIISPDNGKEPIFNESRSIVLVFNGEIYNYAELKTELASKGHNFYTDTDAEVIPHLYEEYGIDFISVLNGMFAFALWDKDRKSLYLVRDRVGQKPLYYAYSGGDIFFSSELRGLKAVKRLPFRPDRASVIRYLAYDYIPYPYTVYEKVFKLEPGSYLLYGNGSCTVKKYWDVSKIREARISFSEAVERFNFLFDESVRMRLMSDVPLGVLLSGGIDSGLITAFASKYKTGIMTFSIGFEDPSYDESRYAGIVAEKFETEHFSEVFDGRKLIPLIDKVIPISGEPFADPSVLPFYLLSEFASFRVKAVLAGDGGDELFCGYPTFIANELHGYFSMLPKSIKTLAGSAGNLIKISDKNFSLDFKVKAFFRCCDKDLPIREQCWLGGFSYDELILLFGRNLKLDEGDIYGITVKSFSENADFSVMNRLSLLYLKTYLTSILHKADIASMANSLEVRAPFLDYRIVEFVLSLPESYKCKLSRTKRLLKSASRGILPRKITGRKKKGFGIPLSEYFRTVLKDEITDESFIRFFSRYGMDGKYIAGLVDKHIRFKTNERKKLWPLYVLYKWGK